MDITAFLKSTEKNYKENKFFKKEKVLHQSVKVDNNDKKGSQKINNGLLVNLMDKYDKSKDDVDSSDEFLMNIDNYLKNHLKSPTKNASTSQKLNSSSNSTDKDKIILKPLSSRNRNLKNLNSEVNKEDTKNIKNKFINDNKDIKTPSKVVSPKTILDDWKDDDIIKSILNDKDDEDEDISYLMPKEKNNSLEKVSGSPVFDWKQEVLNSLRKNKNNSKDVDNNESDKAKNEIITGNTSDFVKEKVQTKIYDFNYGIKNEKENKLIKNSAINFG